MAVTQDAEILLELQETKKQLLFLKSIDPFRVTDMAIELATEKSRVSLAIDARDAVVQRLVQVHALLESKSAELEKCRHDHSALHSPLANISPALADIPGLEQTPIECEEISILQHEASNLRKEIENLTAEATLLKSSKKAITEPPPCYEDDDTPLLFRNHNVTPNLHSDHIRASSTPAPLISPLVGASFSPGPRTSTPAGSVTSEAFFGFDDHDDPHATINARHALLAEMPLPEEAPEEALTPIMLPSSISFSDFIHGVENSNLRLKLSNYRILSQSTTNWCPQREEHGYFLAPVFKCSTNPRVNTAHRWNLVDVMAKLHQPIECFHNNDGKWYYAGTYQALRLDDLTRAEWDTLSPESSSAIIKETLNSRKNTSPQNVYEISQLYGCGALRVACVALQCVGFNQKLYEGVLDQANQLRWKLTSSPNASGPHATSTMIPRIPLGRSWMNQSHPSSPIPGNVPLGPQPSPGGFNGHLPNPSQIVKAFAAMSISRKDEVRVGDENCPPGPRFGGGALGRRITGLGVGRLSPLAQDL
ncbi:hypothetical protein DL96DRAFT_208179 [Flagelloscypha sp. PMI_526]|nr:hypothetical protein DL96DRAFT_208179 [Flagelloscypha sp. PMI_526]